MNRLSLFVSSFSISGFKSHTPVFQSRTFAITKLKVRALSEQLQDAISAKDANLYRKAYNSYLRSHQFTLLAQQFSKNEKQIEEIDPQYKHFLKDLEEKILHWKNANKHEIIGHSFSWLERKNKPINHRLVWIAMKAAINLSNPKESLRIFDKYYLTMNLSKDCYVLALRLALDSNDTSRIKKYIDNYLQHSQFGHSPILDRCLYHFQIHNIPSSDLQKTISNMQQQQSVSSKNNNTNNTEFDQSRITEIEEWTNQCLSNQLSSYNTSQIRNALFYYKQKGDDHRANEIYQQLLKRSDYVDVTLLNRVMCQVSAETGDFSLATEILIKNKDSKGFAVDCLDVLLRSMSVQNYGKESLDLFFKEFSEDYLAQSHSLTVTLGQIMTHYGSASLLTSLFEKCLQKQYYRVAGILLYYQMNVYCRESPNLIDNIPKILEWFARFPQVLDAKCINTIMITCVNRYKSYSTAVQVFETTESLGLEHDSRSYRKLFQALEQLDQKTISIHQGEQQDNVDENRYFNKAMDHFETYLRHNRLYESILKPLRTMYVAAPNRSLRSFEERVQNIGIDPVDLGKDARASHGIFMDESQEIVTYLNQLFGISNQSLNQ